MLKFSILKRSIAAVILACLALLLPFQVSAQTGATLRFRVLEAEAFPILAGYFDARDAAGLPITGLEAADLQALEDGVAQPITQLRTVQPGLRIIVVLSPGEPFSIRDGTSTTRFDYVKQSVLDWAEGLPARNENLLTLVAAEGDLVSNGTSSQWIGAFESVPDTFATQVSALPFQQALESAAAPSSVPGMNTVIWWITASPQPETLTELPQWQAELQEQGIPLFVWQIDSRSTFDTESSQALQTLATATGGQWFGYSNGEAFPDPEDYFDPFRSVYFFQYNSQLRTGGTHEIQLQLTRDAEAVVSPALSFDLDIRPPNPVLVSPPAQIQRGPSPSDPQALSPFSQPIEILVEFPDDFPRDIVRTSLYVNNELAAENTSAPFTRFAWDLSAYTVSQQVTLRVEAEDAFGLVGSSVDFPVQVLVENPLNWFQAFLSSGGPALAISGVVLAAGAVFLVLVLSGRLRPPTSGLSRARRRRATTRPIDPLNDSPLYGEPAETGLAAFASLSSKAPAFLQRLNMQEAAQAAKVFPLDASEFSIGSEPGNTIVVEDPSVDPHHAQLTRLEDGAYRVADLRTGAGTWINYAPVSGEGGLLRDGDLLHIGRVAFRFLLAKETPKDEAE